MHRSFPTLGAAVLSALFVALPAPAQGLLSCNVTAVPTVLRAEGLTELIGDIVLSCTGGLPTPSNQPIPRINLTLLFGTGVTNRILSNGGSDALVLVDEPGSAANPVQRLCPSLSGCVVAGNGGTGEPFNGDPLRPNIFQGMVSANSVTFFGVPADPPGAATRSYRIKNVRINANGNTDPSGQVRVGISQSGDVRVLINNPRPLVGTISTSLTFSGGSISLPQCAPLLTTSSPMTLAYTETFAAAFKPRTLAGADPAATARQNSPTLGYLTESGFLLPDLPGAGLADSGTRLKAVFKNLPAGVNLWVSTQNVGATATAAAQLVASETGAYIPVFPTATFFGLDAAQVPVQNGVATAVWEVTANNPAAANGYYFLVFLSSSTALDVNLPTATVNGSLAPVSTTATAEAAPVPIPRFVDTSSASPIISFQPCQTNLLFAFVTNEGPFDTGIGIANTTADPFGTAHESGTCTLTAYGSNAPPQSFVTPTIAAGASYTATLSSIFPNFKGYLVASCNFLLAHGYAFISDLGATRLATGYLALIIPGDPSLRPNTGDSESLVH